MEGIGRQSFIVIFDFDNTVVNCNTDEVIFTALGRCDLQRKLIAERKLQWTKLIDTLAAPYSKSELLQAVRDSVYIDPDMPEVFAYLRRMQDKYALPFTCPEGDGKGAGLAAWQVPRFLEVDIASDSNTFFIEASLQSCLPGALPLIRQIHSNPYYEVDSLATANAGRDVCYGPDAPVTSCNDDDEALRDAAYNAGRTRRSRVCWYEPFGTECEWCTACQHPNLCKSAIVHRILNTTTLVDPTIILVGDGANDYCPVLNVLRPRDYVFARFGYPLHRRLSSGASDAPAGGCCAVGLWADAKELLGLFRTVLQHPALRLPTLARMRDISDDEFRAVTLQKRMPSVVQRAMNDNKAYLTPAGVKRLEALQESLRVNGPVPLLPGQHVVPAWLRNYAFTTEHDRRAPNPLERAAAGRGEVWATPRWGQVPWLHGEIYFAHLLWQALMLREEPAAPTSAGAGVVNIITPYAIHNPLFSQQCHTAATAGIVSPGGIPHQALCTEFLARAPLRAREGIVVRLPSCTGDTSGYALQPYADLVSPAGDSLLFPPSPPPSADAAQSPSVFMPYRDIFTREKSEVLLKFVRARIVPMLACEPWAAPLEFCGVLLRWMLWGNGMDLSMFTLQELTSVHQKAAHGTVWEAEEQDEARAAAQLAELREKESVSALAKDGQIVCSDLERLCQHLFKVLRGEAADHASILSDAAPRQIDIVMDNVGTECISDLCFGLWFIEQASAHRGVGGGPTTSLDAGGTVVFHVKPHPYYVSDVTPHDMDDILSLLESTYGDPAAAPHSEPLDAVDADKELLRGVLMPFVGRVREAFARGRFRLDADTVWTQPSEYRELPPRVINGYFYTQQVAPASLEEGAGWPPGAPSWAEADVGAAGNAFRARKVRFRPRTALVIFKGDLNFRRVVGDRHWDRSDFMTSLAAAVPALGAGGIADARAESLCDTPEDRLMSAPTFQEVISAYWPTCAVPVCCIRIIKSECCVGVTGTVKKALDEMYGAGKADAAAVQNSKGRPWCVSGQVGVILLAA